MKSRGIFAALTCIMLIFTPGLKVSAIDVAAGVTEVIIPISINSTKEDPITGVDIWFKCSADLTPMEVIAPTDLTFGEIDYDESDDTYYIGVFETAPENSIKLTNNNISIYSIKCSFTGSGSSTLTFTEVIVYRINERNTVDLEYIEGNDLPAPITVTRSGTAAPGQGSTAVQGSGDSNNPVSTPASGTDGTGGVQGGLSDSGAVSPLDTAASSDTIVSASGKTTFTDIAEAEWAREAIEYLATYKGILGTGYGLFTPNANVTRAQFARFLGQAFDLQGTTSGVSFSDVTASDWFYSDVMKLVSLNIIKGYDSGLFGPNDFISREQMATMVDRTLEYFGFNLNAFGLTTMSDIYTTADYSRLSVQRLYEAGLINGMGDNAFYPRSYTTRGQSAAIIYKALTFAGKG